MPPTSLGDSVKLPVVFFLQTSQGLGLMSSLSIREDLPLVFTLGGFVSLIPTNGTFNCIGFYASVFVRLLCCD